MSKYFPAVKSFSIKEIIDLINAEVVGEVDYNKQIEDIDTLQNANNNQLTFLSNPKFASYSKYGSYLKDTKAYACLVNSDFKPEEDIKVPLLKVKDAYFAFAILLQKLHPAEIFQDFVSETANISSTAKVGSGCYIGHGVVIGEHVTIGNNCYIGANSVISNQASIGNNCYIAGLVSIKYCSMGNNCIIHEGARIGQDGFGFAPTATGNVKIPQIGGVEIGDHVEIGANSCIDRGALQNTVIKQGTKIDNLVQVAHNVEIGASCFLASQVGVSGSTKVGNGVAMGGQAGLAPHIEIGDFAQIAPQTGVNNSVPTKAIMIGSPAKPFYEFWRIQAIINKLVKKKD